MAQDDPVADSRGELGDLAEGRGGVARVEAFSDGVLAIIITIMVLELKPPHGADFSALWELWPTMFAYVNSYLYIAIYWVNHHRLFGHATKVTNELMWANIALLFTLSLLPFTTAWVGHYLASPQPAALYLVSLLSPCLAYFWLGRVIERTGHQDRAARTYYRANLRKALWASAVYALGIGACFVSAPIGLTLAGLVAVFWILPWGPLDRLFLSRESA